MSKWILKDGKNYFKQWTGIGPMSTQEKSEAMRFESKEEAMRSPAFAFVITCYAPVEVKK